MSFRGRLALFFILLVVIPVAAIAVLVVDVTGDSEAGKADARLSIALEVALTTYDEDVAEADAQLTDLLTQPAVEAALRSGDPAAIEAALEDAARGSGLESLAVEGAEGATTRVVGSGDPFAAATKHANVEGADSYTLIASVTGPTEYVEVVSRRTGLETAIGGAGAVVASTTPVDGIHLPNPGDSRDTEVGGEEVRAAATELPEGERVYVFTETEAGGFFDSSPRIAAAVVLFVALALAFIAFIFRALQGQIAAMLDAARRIGAGDFSQRVPVVGKDEMAGLASEFNRMSDRLEGQIDQLRRQRTELDRAVTRLGEAVASGLDRETILAIVAETALGACEAEACRIVLDDGTTIEAPKGYGGAAREAILAGQTRAAKDGAQIAARRKEGHALAAPLRTNDGEIAGTIAVGRVGTEFDQHERDVFVYLLSQASASIGNIAEHERAAEQAVTDELTGLANNRAFRGEIAREAARSERFGHELSLVILDVDDFKQVNDTRGHLQGDEVLRAIGRILDDEPRAIDNAARYGGEEFVVALPETGATGAEELAERIRVRLEEEDVPAVDGGEPVRVTASFGVATMPGAAESVRELFAAADEALYEAKRKGKNRVVAAPATAGRASSLRRGF